ncbi:MAG: short-chain dehydrogenase, partial [Cyanobacteria bacterium J06621_3]
RMELSPFGINVVTVQPGAVQSNIGISAEKALAGVLGPNSWYIPYKQTIQDRTTLSQVNSTPADQFATQLVKRLIQIHPPAVIRLGNKSLWLPFLKRWLPIRLMEFILKRRFRLLSK